MSIFFFCFAGLYLFFALGHAFGTPASPKSGFLPTIAGLVGVGLAGIVVVRQFLRRQEDGADEYLGRHKMTLFVLGLLSYVVLIKIAGYLPATFLLMVYLLKITETVGWFFPIVVSAGVAVSFFIVFQHFLGIVLP